MNQLATQTSALLTSSSLSVSYKSTQVTKDKITPLPQAIITTDSSFIIQGLNDAAVALYGFAAKEVKGKCFFDLVDFEMIGISLSEAIHVLFTTTYWQGDVIYHHRTKKIIFGINCVTVKNSDENAATVIITAVKKVNEQPSQSNITTKLARREIDKMFERYTFAINASSDAIWDMDIVQNTVYRSDAFSAFTGYSKKDILPTIDWFFDKIHPQDRTRVETNITHCLTKNIKQWENEYRFLIADGSYRHLLDKGHAIYEDGKITRVIGAMQDMTDRKKLEAQLLNEQVQKQKMVNQAIIQTQETERNRISGELHDNVNQLLMSAKLHICVAKTRAEGETELLDKATQYLLMAVEEIRDLSKRLNSSLLSNGGLQKNVDDIAKTMLLLKNIQLHSYINHETVTKLLPDQQIMVYRIIQEQSNNILKYAETNEAIISLKEVNNNFELIISDNGKGFDKNQQKATGIGLINIFTRVDAYNGKVEIITSPGNGCTLLINFPVAQHA